MRIYPPPSVRIGIFAIALCALDARAMYWFAERQVLTADKTIDLVTWVSDTAEGGAERWSCDSVSGGPFPVSTCQTRAIARGTGPRDEYLDFAFFIARPSSLKADLAPRTEQQESAFDGLERPLLALRQQNDSCTYLILFRDMYAPLAAGQFACKDIRAALAGVDRDMHDRYGLVPKPKSARVHKRISGSSASAYANQLPDRLDYGFEASFGPAIGMSADETENEGTPFESKREAFDFNDFADMDQVPLGLRAYFSWCGAAGFRAGYQYSRYRLAGDVYNGLESGIAAQGGALQSWKIARHDWSFELLLGKTAANKGVEFGAHGILGMIMVDFDETIKVDGREFKEGILKDENGVILGFGGDLLMGRHVLLGLEAGLLIKGFRMKNVASQPDGTGNELQIRLRLGGFDRIEFGAKTL